MRLRVDIAKTYRAYAQALLCLVLLATAGLDTARADGLMAAKVKAAVIFNFAKFVAWPDQAESADETFVIALCGAGDLESHLRAYTARPVQGRFLDIVIIGPDDPLPACRILFLGEDVPLSALSDELADRPVLTISDRPGFLDDGGMVQLYLSQDRKIRFDIDDGATRDAGMIINSKILRLKRSPD